VPPDRRLLILCRNPAKASFRLRVGQHLDLLRSRGLGVEVEDLAHSPWHRRRQLRRAGGRGGILLQKTTLRVMDAWHLRGRRARLIYDFDDAVMCKSNQAALTGGGRMRRFRRTARLADLVIAGNETLAGHARDAGTARVAVLPTALDVRRYQPKRNYAAAGPLRLVWIGSRSTLRQMAAMMELLEAIGRRRQGITLRIIADAGLQARHLRVENVPWSLEAETRLLAECDIGVAPLPDTAFARGKCAFKVAQYMAAGLPVITSPVGANAQYVRDGENGFHAADAVGWARAFDRLADDAALRERFGRAGRRRAEEELDSAVVGPKLCDAIAQCLEGGPAGTVDDPSRQKHG
jgi:glycosyltransferase involved in cell wall biosynthesis